jgi:polyferredoxin
METKNKTNKFSTRISNDQNIRLLVQTAFLLLILRIGYEFYGFVKYYQTNGATPYFERPPGVEGFLPISSLMGLIHFVTTGDFNSIHPAGIVLFFIFFLFAILLKKGFCGWVCPVGFLSEYLWKLGRKVFGRNFVLPRWLDYPLRSLKYLILLFFVWAIVTMSSGELNDFLYGKYNKIADVKMLLFFTDILNDRYKIHLHY